MKPQSTNALDLVIQGDAIVPADLKRIAASVGSTRTTEQPFSAHRVYRLHGATVPPLDRADRRDLDRMADLRTFDYAWVPAGRRLSDFRLLAMDMDSTLINIECIDEIADFVGKKAAVAEITARAMRGEIDWPQSLRERVALLAGLEEAVLARVYEERLRLSPGAEALIRAAKMAGLHIMLVSGGFTYFTELLKQRLGLDYATSNQLEITDGKLTGRVTGPLCDAEGKARSVRETARFLGFHREQVMVIGDGANDLKMMAEAGTSIAWHAKPIVRQQASHAINFVGLDGVLGLFPAN